MRKTYKKYEFQGKKSYLYGYEVTTVSVRFLSTNRYMLDSFIGHNVLDSVML